MKLPPKPSHGLEMAKVHGSETVVLFSCDWDKHPNLLKQPQHTSAHTHTHSKSPSYIHGRTYMPMLPALEPSGPEPQRSQQPVQSPAVQHGVKRSERLWMEMKSKV